MTVLELPNTGSPVAGGLRLIEGIDEEGISRIAAEISVLSGKTPLRLDGTGPRIVLESLPGRALRHIDLIGLFLACMERLLSEEEYRGYRDFMEIITAKKREPAGPLSKARRTSDGHKVSGRTGNARGGIGLPAPEGQIGDGG